MRSIGIEKFILFFEINPLTSAAFLSARENIPEFREMWVRALAQKFILHTVNGLVINYYKKEWKNSGKLKKINLWTIM